MSRHMKDRTVQSLMVCRFDLQGLIQEYAIPILEIIRVRNSVI